MRHVPCFFTWILAAWLGVPAWAAPTPEKPSGDPSPSPNPWFGPAWSEFDTAFQPGHSVEAVGPLWESTDTDGEHLWRFSPFVVRVTEPALEKVEWNVLYPAMAYRRYGTEWRLHIFQFFGFSGGSTVDEETKRRITIFPIYFRQKSSNPTNDYLAVLPFYGHLHNRLFRSEMRFILAPLYVQTRKPDYVTDNYLVPFFHVRRGPFVNGWQFWPLAGAEHRAVSYRTNVIDELEVVPGYEKKFLLWPFGFSQHLEIGGANPTTNLFVFPFYLRSQSPEQDHLWIAMFSHRTNRVAKFEEWSYPWPFLGHARGPGKQADRIWPLWGHARGGALESDFFLWPLYVHKRLQSDPLDRERRRILYFGYDDLRQTDTATGRSFRRRELWPLFTWRRELDGRERLQVLAPIEPILGGNVNIERLYSPLWSVWRSESNPKLRIARQSLLWNLWQREQRTNDTRTSLFFGAVQSERTVAGRNWSFFGLGRNRAKGPTPPPAPGPTPTPMPTPVPPQARVNAGNPHRGPELRLTGPFGPATASLPRIEACRTSAPMLSSNGP